MILQVRENEARVLHQHLELSHKYGSRFGVDNLRMALSDLLARRIARNLKKIEAQLDLRFRNTKALVTRLIEARKHQESPLEYGLMLLYSFKEAIRNEIFAGYLQFQDDGLYKDAQQKYNQFASVIRGTQPGIVLPGNRPGPLGLLYNDSNVSDRTLLCLLMSLGAHSSVPLTAEPLHFILLASTC